MKRLVLFTMLLSLPARAEVMDLSAIAKDPYGAPLCRLEAASKECSPASFAYLAVAALNGIKSNLTAGMLSYRIAVTSAAVDLSVEEKSMLKDGARASLSPIAAAALCMAIFPRDAEKECK